LGLTQQVVLLSQMDSPPNASLQVTKLGGTVKNAVVKGLDYLVLGNLEGEATTKKEAAEKKGVKILNEEEFIKLTRL